MFRLHTFADLKDQSAQQIRHRFGGKLLGLYEAHQLGLPIPLTSMVSAQIHEAFLNQSDQAIPFIEKNLGAALNGFEEGLYAVRSSCQVEDSSSHSFAGVFETKLFVSKSELAEAIASVWNSFALEKARSYSKVNSLMGVIIQPMVEAKYAGVCFTKHPSPTTIFENGQIVVEFAPTTGEKVVQGEVIPTRLCASADALSSVSESGWMNDLLKAIFELKKRYHREADIEFVIDKNDDFWLLQQRPISKIWASKTLDLSDYRRMYKRSLLSLDIELLIDGCARFLAPYLEVPISLERWMVMTTSEVQELWVDEILNETVLRAVIDKIEHDPTYLHRIEARYADHYRRLKGSQPTTLFEWFEWMTPFAAHYYAPMFMIEALYTSILREIRSFDPENAEKDLFELSTVGIASLIDLLNNDLRPFKNRSFKECESKLQAICEKFGFLKCRQPFEDPYTPEELYEMSKNIPDPSPPLDLSEKKAKYVHQEHLIERLNHLREWMRIRNQEMEEILQVLQSPFLNYEHARPFQDL